MENKEIINDEVKSDIRRLSKDLISIMNGCESNVSRSSFNKLIQLCFIQQNLINELIKKGNDNNLN